MPTEEGQKLRHACSTCARSFSSKRDLVKHQYMHREKPQLVCSHCNKTFTTESNYKRHLNAIQNNDRKRYSCNNCGKPFRRLRDLESHHDSEHRDDKVFRCKVCQAEFSWRENLLKHEQVHNVNPHVCGTCSREFIDMTSLLVHKRIHHVASKTDPRKNSAATKGEIDSKQTIDDGKPFTCHICGRGFKFDFSYQAHLDGHVIPITEEKYYTDESTEVSQPVSGMSKSLYVQMDSEGIIDLPALNNTNNEEVEIIVEVGNITTSGAITFSSLGLEVLTGDATEEDGEANKSIVGTVKDDSDSQTKPSDDETKVERDDKSERIITFYEPDKKQENERQPAISKVDVVNQTVTTVSSQASFVPGKPFSSRPKKPPKRKRERTPFQFNCVMTDDKPFICSTCGEAFRWEISLQVHTKVHTDGKVPGIRKMYMSNRMTVKKTDKAKNGSAQESGVKKSRIVYQRHSSEEEEEEEEDPEDAYAFRNERDDDETPLSYHHAKKLAEKKLVAENADDILQEYLVGGDLESDDGGSDRDMEAAELPSGEKKKCADANRTKYRNDDSWRKGKAILRKKRTWKTLKLKPADDLQADGAGDDKSLTAEAETKAETSEDQVVFTSMCNVDHGQSFAVTCVDSSAKDQSVSQFGIVGPCLMATFPLDLATVTNDDRIAMAAAYSAAVQPVTVPVVIQNGFKEEGLALVTSEQQPLAMLQCIPIESTSLQMQTAVLNTGTLICNSLGEVVQEVSTGTLSVFSQHCGIVSSEMTADAKSNENDCTMCEPADIQSTVSVSISQITSEVNIIESGVSHVDEAVTFSSDSESNNVDKSCLDSTKVIYFADESQSLIIDNHMEEEPVPSNTSSLTKLPEVVKDCTSVDEFGNSSMKQKISAGLEALKAIVTSSRSVSAKAGEGFVENFASESVYSHKGECVKSLNSIEGAKVISSARSGHCFQSKKGQASCQRKGIGGGVGVVPCRVRSDKDGFRLGSRKCAKCGKLFTCRRSLMRHFHLHRPLKLNCTTCNFCSKRFFSKASLDRHSMLHVA